MLIGICCGQLFLRFCMLFLTNIIKALFLTVSGLIAMVVGAMWYGPLFGKLWMQGMGWDPNNQALMAEKKKSASRAYAQMFVLVLVQAYVLAHVLWAYSVALPEVIGVSAGLQSAFWLWLGFILPIKYGDKLWGGKAFKYVAIDLGYYLVVLAVMGIVLSLWR